MSLKAAITMNRFGLSARLKLGAQQAVPATQVIAALPGRPQLGQDFREYQMQSRELPQARDAGPRAGHVCRAKEEYTAQRHAPKPAG